MAAYTVAVRERGEVAERTLGLSFDKPANFTFKAGQFLDMTLLNSPETDAQGNRRSLSIASAPHEAQLLLATRLRQSAFKRVLNTMAVGTEVKVEGPYGNFVLHGDASRLAVLLAGGIGITPFRSMVLRATKDKLTHRLLLFYANRRPMDAAFLNELQALQSENSNYTFVPTMTAVGQKDQSWSGETGHITEQMIAKYLERSDRPVCYIAGPPAMVEATQKVLVQLGIGEDDIRAEEFAGY